MTRDRHLEATSVLHRRLRDLYKLGPLHTARVLLGADSFVDLLNRYRYLQQIADVLVARTTEFELVSMESIRGGALTELLYAAKLRKGVSVADLIAELRDRNAGQRVAVLTGYDQTDL